MNTFAALKSKLKYFFSRLIVLLVAVHTLDVSIDLDHITADLSGKNKIETYDDIDSFSEYVIEKIFDNDKLTGEGDHDDRNPLEKQALKHQVLYTAFRQEIKLEPAVIPSSTGTPTPIIRNASLQAEDHSLSNFIPPDQPVI